MSAAMDTAPILPSEVRDSLGRPLRDLRLSVIEACNVRCPYCMPAEQVPEDYGFDAAQRLSFDEIETLVRGFVRAGVTKLRLTGGEPLLRKRLPDLIARLSRIEACRTSRSRRTVPYSLRTQQRYEQRACTGLPSVWMRWVLRCSAPCRENVATSPRWWPVSKRQRQPASRRSSSTVSCSAA